MLRVFSSSHWGEVQFSVCGLDYLYVSQPFILEMIVVCNIKSETGNPLLAIAVSVLCVEPQLSENVGANPCFQGKNVQVHVSIVYELYIISS